MLTESTEMYLIAIYRLTQHELYASTSGLAAALGVSPASVSEKIKSLANQGYLIHEWREGVVLTPKGKKVALNVLRKHRILSTYLVENVGYQIDETFDEVCRMEHAVSDKLVNRLEEILGFPEVDPLGKPIPGRDGQIKPRHHRMLSEMPAGKSLVVQSLSTEDSERLRYLRTLGLVPGSEIVIDDVAPFDGPITIVVGKKKVAISPSLAAIIGVSNGSEEQK